jgi:Na+-transporting NADH:ubiquinone oxidoreductase subunit NqrF
MTTGMLQILLGVGVFTGIVLLLVVVILVARSRSSSTKSARSPRRSAAS